MKGKSKVFVPLKSTSGSISFMGEGSRADFAKFISNRNDIDPDGLLDIVAHGNEIEIEIANGEKYIRINSRVAAKLIKNLPDYKNKKGIRLFSCSTGALKNGFAQNLANALGKPVYAPNMTIHTYSNGVYWISENDKKGEFIKFLPGGNRNGK